MVGCVSMGKLTDGTEVKKYTLTNKQGAFVEIATLGGCLLSIYVPDKNGKLGDVTLGYTSLPELCKATGYMGFLIGRYANRIGGACFELNGKAYTLAKNNGENHLHGGLHGFDKYVWNAAVQGEALELSMHSPDGDEGYPGALNVKVTYAVSDDNTLSIRYQAVSSEDTIINLTNHVYFNLAGPACRDLSTHAIQIDADTYTEVQSRACIPTGSQFPVDGTPFDLRNPRNIQEGLALQDTDTQMQYGNGYDHNFPINSFDGAQRRCATVTETASGRRMETWTDQPGVQFYAGNGISGDTPGKCGVPYIARQGFCLETQHYPDSIHHESFPSCVLKAGDTYETVTEYRFSVE